MTRSLFEPDLYSASSKNSYGVERVKRRTLAFRWWEPDCISDPEDPETDAGAGCNGEEPPLENGWAQPASPLEKFAFRLHADGSLEFKGHLDSASAASGTVAVTLPGAVPGEVDFLPANDQFFVSAVYDGATAQSALVYIDSTTGEVTITFPL